MVRNWWIKQLKMQNFVFCYIDGTNQHLFKNHWSLSAAQHCQCSANLIISIVDSSIQYCSCFEFLLCYCLHRRLCILNTQNVGRNFQFDSHSKTTTAFFFCWTSTVRCLLVVAPFINNFCQYIHPTEQTNLAKCQHYVRPLVR